MNLNELSKAVHTANLKWCKHIKLETTKNWVCYELYDHTHIYQIIPDKWQFCPLCGIKRPIGNHVHHFMSFKEDKSEVCIKCGIQKPKQ